MDNVIVDLLQQSAEGNAALMRGDVDGWHEKIALTDDFTLMSPLGGKPTHAAEMTPDTDAAMGQFFHDGTFAHDLVQSYPTADMVVLAVIERTHVAVGGRPAQNWLLRVTLVYLRDGSAWRLAHRHADPLVAGISVDQAAALARNAPNWLERASCNARAPACGPQMQRMSYRVK
jgi:ketosteroid isomerase-like protein